MASPVGTNSCADMDVGARGWLQGLLGLTDLEQKVMQPIGILLHPVHEALGVVRACARVV